MKKLVIQFEFSDDVNYDEIVDEVTRIKYPLYTDVSWTILERK
jgi:hypothetical protein